MALFSIIEVLYMQFAYYCGTNTSILQSLILNMLKPTLKSLKKITNEKLKMTYGGHGRQLHSFC